MNKTIYIDAPAPKLLSIKLQAEFIHIDDAESCKSKFHESQLQQVIDALTELQKHNLRNKE